LIKKVLESIGNMKLKIVDNRGNFTI